MDDEKQLVRMGQQMLERLGYSVTARTSSVEALEAFRAQPDRFDLVITDQTMPNMTNLTPPWICQERKISGQAHQTEPGSVRDL